MSKKLTTEEFIERAKKVHGDKYDYSNFKHTGHGNKSVIICPIHKEMIMTPRYHINSEYGCQKCGEINRRRKKMLTSEEFIERAKKIHVNKYEYSKTIYSGGKNDVSVFCLKHGEFSVNAERHLYETQGCRKCEIEIINKNTALTKGEFLEKAFKKHGNKYDYSKIKYVNNHIKIIIKCPIHGEFLQIPMSHISGCGCRKCGTKNFSKKRTHTTEIFIQESIEKYGNKYDYSLVEYKNSKIKVKIICPIEGHSIFMQTPNNHLTGKCGCNRCVDLESSYGERTIEVFLKNKKLEYKSQKKFDDCKNILQLSFDFYIPSINVCIEYNGEQHYKPIKWFGGMEDFIKRQKRDKIKTDYCKSNGIELIVIRFDENIEERLKQIFL